MITLTNQDILKQALSHLHEDPFKFIKDIPEPPFIQEWRAKQIAKWEALGRFGRFKSRVKDFAYESRDRFANAWDALRGVKHDEW